MSESDRGNVQRRLLSQTTRDVLFLAISNCDNPLALSVPFEIVTIRNKVNKGERDWNDDPHLARDNLVLALEDLIIADRIPYSDYYNYN